jgi:hypothetical protein
MAGAALRSFLQLTRRDLPLRSRASRDPIQGQNVAGKASRNGLVGAIFVLVVSWAQNLAHVFATDVTPGLCWRREFAMFGIGQYCCPNY